jgi:hypothetical protein
MRNPLSTQALTAALAIGVVAAGLDASALLAQQQPGTPPAREARPAPVQDTVPPAAAPNRTPRQTAATDSVIARLLRLEGYVPVEYQGKSAAFSSDTRTLRLDGDAQVVRQGDRLTADTILFHQNRNLVEAFGKPMVSGQAQEIEGDTLLYDFERQRATIRGGRTRVDQNATWLVQGDVVAERVGTQDRIYTTAGCFTTDERFGACAREGEEMPQYHFQADRIMIIRDRVLVARPVRLYFQNVPVFWLPFLAQTLERGRRSGVLVPEFSVNDIVQTSRGQSRSIDRVGFYWAMSDYMDAQLFGGWRSNEYTSLSGNLQYNVARQFLNGHFGYSQYWREGGNNQFTLNTDSRWRPTERTNLGLRAQYSSSSQFLRNITDDPYLVTQDLQSNASMAQRFDWGNMTLSADRRQGVSSGDVSMTLPSVMVNTNPITLFEMMGADSRWYNNANLSIGNVSYRRSTTSFGEDATRLRPDQERLDVSWNGIALRVGDLQWSAGTTMNREASRSLMTQDTLIDARLADRGNWNSSLSYRIPLVASTAISPTFSFNQEFVRDERTDDEYLSAPMRMSIGAGLNTDLYGFVYPTFGPYSAIRHKVTPTISYAYSPEVTSTARQDSVFRAAGRPQNRVSLSLNQTFEAKVREPRVEHSDTADSGGATATAGASNPQTQTLLRLNTSAIEFDFQPDENGVRRGLMTRTIRNSISSDLLAGINVNVAHDLFDSRDVPTEERQHNFGRFAPQLTELSTGFSLGPNSWLFRQLGLGGRNTVTATQPQPGSEMDTDAHGFGADMNRQMPGTRLRSSAPFGSTSPFAGGGTQGWNLAFDYAYNRQRAMTHEMQADPNQTLNARVSMPLTQNWSMNWNTSYSITDTEFGAHQLALVRNLHRWQATFNFNRTPTGLTSFNFLVQLIDLPDLKFDYRERGIGQSREPVRPR